MTLEQFINGLVLVTLVEMMVAVGLGVTVAELLAILRQGPLVLRAALANYLCVPLATLLLLTTFAPEPMVGVGFLILAACPGAPFSHLCVKIARGDTGVAVALMALLAGSSAVLAPFLLRLLLPLVAGDQKLEVDGVRLATTLGLTQLLPLAVGLGIRHWLPRWAQLLQPSAALLSKVLSLLLFGLILYAQYQMLADIRWYGFIGMLLLLAVSLASGWLLGGPGQERRRAVALTTSLRNVGPGLVIATSTFAGTPAATAVVAYGIVEILGSFAVAGYWHRMGGMHHGTTSPPANRDLRGSAERPMGGTG